MAARLKPHHQEDIKAKIQSVKLVQLLQDDAIGKLSPELTQGRRDSAKFLVNKTISNAPTDINQELSGTFEIKAPWLTAAAKKRGW